MFKTDNVMLLTGRWSPEEYFTRIVVAIYEGRWTQICHQTTSQHHVLQCFNNPRQKNHNSTKYSHISCTGWGSTGESPIRCICLHAWWPVWHQINWL